MHRHSFVPLDTSLGYLSVQTTASFRRGRSNHWTLLVLMMMLLAVSLRTLSVQASRPFSYKCKGDGIRSAYRLLERQRGAACSLPRIRGSHTHGEGPQNTNAVNRSDSVKPSPTLRFWRGVRRTASDIIQATGFISSAATAVITNRSQFSRWQPTVQAMKNFLKTSGIELELSSSLNVRLLDYSIMLGRIQAAALAGRDIRDLALSRRNPILPPKEECLRYMRYATAAYGETMITAAEYEVKGRVEKTNILSPLTRTRISDHIDIPEDDIVVMDIDYDGDHNHLRHFIAVDHKRRKVVLAIRGTFSLSEMLVDVAGFSRPFCGGEAHSEMAIMAEKVWDVAGPKVQEMLSHNTGYELILTGHSLGAGCACLLNILCHQNGRKRVLGNKVRCFAYASPPVFTPLEFAPDAVDSCVNVIHESDVVPFLSIDSVRHLFGALRVIDQAKLGWHHRLKLVTGYEAPGHALIQDVNQATQQRLPTKPGAPLLVIPAAANLWLRETGKHCDRYDMKVCDSTKLAHLGVKIDPDMISDHFPPRYEHALSNLSMDNE